MENELLSFDFGDPFLWSVDLYIMAVIKLVAVLLAGMFILKTLCILLWTNNFTFNRKEDQ